MRVIQVPISDTLCPLKNKRKFRLLRALPIPGLGVSVCIGRLGAQFGDRHSCTPDGTDEAGACRWGHAMAPSANKREPLRASDWLRLIVPLVLVAAFILIAWKLGYFSLKD